MPRVELVFNQQGQPVTGGPVHLVFGARGGLPPPTVVAEGGGRITGLRGHVRMHAGVRAVASGRITGLRGHIGARWDANVSRVTRVEMETAWAAAAASRSAVRAPWQETTPVQIAAIARWQLGFPVVGGVAAAWQESERLRSGAAAFWQEAQALRGSVSPAWQESLRQRSSVDAHWQEAQALRGAVSPAWQETVRLRGSSRSAWSDAVHLGVLFRSGFTDGARQRATLRPHWQEARRPPAGEHADMPPVRPDPCYVPSLPARLVFRLANDGKQPVRLVFICDGHGPDPEPPQFIIPLLRVYMTVHSIDAVLLPSMERVHLKGITIDANDDGFGWRMTASGPLHLLDQLARVNGLPPQVRVTVDGINWVFAIDPPERSRKFGERLVQVRGSSVTSLLGAPYMPADIWANATDMTAQQLALQALELSGVSLDWQIPDWLVPAGAWAHQGTPLSAIMRIAEAAGAVVRSHRTDAQLQVAPRYTRAPWAWPTAPLNVSMPGHIITADTLQPMEGTAFNGVYVVGTAPGSPKGFVRISGTVGDVLAPQVTDALITHETAARQRGITVLGNAAIRYQQPITVPLLTGGSNPGLFLPGYLIEVIEPGETWRGMVRSITLRESRPTVRQSLIVERAV